MFPSKLWLCFIKLFEDSNIYVIYNNILQNYELSPELLEIILKYDKDSLNNSMLYKVLFANNINETLIVQLIRKALFIKKGDEYGYLLAAYYLENENTILSSNLFSYFLLLDNDKVRTSLLNSFSSLLFGTVVLPLYFLYTSSSTGP